MLRPETESALAQAYVEAFRRDTPAHYIANLATSVSTWKVGDRVVPLTVNCSEPTGTYVCSPHTAYIRYAREELATLPVRGLDRPLRGLIGIFDPLLRRAGIDTIAHLNNWMLSTNLNGGLVVRDGRSLADDLVSAYPDSLIALRSLNRVHHNALIEKLVIGGWQLLPSRQIYHIENIERDWRTRTDIRHDRALMNDGRYAKVEFATMSQSDAIRIAQLYAGLYLGKYSRLNPAFTPAFIQLSHALGMIHFTGLRDHAGCLQAIAGCFRLGWEITAPVVGYDMALPLTEGLYRRASFLISQQAIDTGTRLNLSSGAAKFKRNRGGRPAIEYCALYMRHLPRARRLPVDALRLLLNHVGVPLMEKYQL